jgi:hypothetical protein
LFRRDLHRFLGGAEEMVEGVLAVSPKLVTVASLSPASVSEKVADRFREGDSAKAESRMLVWFKVDVLGTGRSCAPP